MFSYMSARHSVHRGSQCDHYPWCTGLHCTEPLVQSPYRHRTWGPLPMSHTPRHGTWDIWLPSLETCSNLFIGPHCTGLVPVLTSGRMYSWQAGTTHLTGMLSCCALIFIESFCSCTKWSLEFKKFPIEAYYLDDKIISVLGTILYSISRLYQIVLNTNFNDSKMKGATQIKLKIKYPCSFFTF